MILLVFIFIIHKKINNNYIYVYNITQSVKYLLYLFNYINIHITYININMSISK